ncbi:hypothetical protein J4411_03375 [Candidatus Pacearchaeota archaeon]|nr:hypothetical protein [Candidatus Pacearchaeota archaeon]
MKNKFDSKKLSVLELLSKNLSCRISFKIVHNVGLLDSILDLVENDYAIRIENKEMDSEGQIIFYKLSKKGVTYFGNLLDFAKKNYL